MSKATSKSGGRGGSGRGGRSRVQHREGDARDLIEDASDDEETPMTTSRSVTASDLKPEVLPAASRAPPAATCTSAECAASGPGVDDPTAGAPATKAAPDLNAPAADIADAPAAASKPVAATEKCTTCAASATSTATKAAPAAAVDVPAANTAYAPADVATKNAAATEKCATDAAAATDQDSVVRPPKCPTIEA
jgi:hypothetical protein